MKSFLIFAASLLATGTAFNFSCVLPDGDRWYVSDGDIFKWVTRETAEADIEFLKMETDLVQYYLWTKNNPTTAQLLILNDLSILKKSYFNSSNPTRIMVHGFQSSHNSEVCTLIKDAYLKIGPHNVICVDYSKIAHVCYPAARGSALSIGNDLGAFINFLGHAGGLSNKDLVVAGHSLGSHIVGFAGKFLKKSNNTLPVIVACDPAKQLFNYEDCSSRICNTDADFVVSIQTSGKSRFGFHKPIGDGTYYPNGGDEQPGCEWDTIGLCDHLKAYQYFAESIIHNNFSSKKCETYLHALSNQCEEIDNLLKMGSTESIGKKGFFYVPVNRSSPNRDFSLMLCFTVVILLVCCCNVFVYK